MAVAFTPQQQKVIELRDRNILVSAAAGSGKTAVLVERIIRMITDDARPVDIDRLLVVTFTNAAAAEMRERIGLAINRRLEEDPENVHLQKQVSLLHNAQITTIDSFCLFVIRNNFNDIDLDPGFRVADEGELRLLRQDVMQELLEEKYKEKEQSFLNCVEYFTGGSNDKILAEYIEKLYGFSMSCPWPEDWISQCMDDYKITDIIELESTDWCQFLLHHMGTVIEECKVSMDMAVSIIERPDGPYMYANVVEQEREMLEYLLGNESLSAYYEAFEKVSFGRLPSKKDDTVSQVCREKVQQIRKDVKKKLEDLKESYLVLSPQQVVERMAVAAPNVEMLLSLVLAYKERLDDKKRQENIIDFYDMEHFALNILLKKEEDGSISPTPAAVEYRQFFTEILIDEYQDSNLVQELLLKSISGEEDGNFNRFMVGDVKQSIYKFRLARPELFMEKYNCYSKENGSCQRIDLHKNFRSRPQVLDSVNQLFEKIMGRKLGGVEYDEEAALYQGAVYPELTFFEDTSLEELRVSPYETEYLVIGKDAEEPLSAREQEAAAIAGKIRQLRQSLKVTDKETGSLRPLRYGDIVILLRTAAGWAQDFKKILEKEGIPAYVTSQTGYFQAVEIRTLLQLLNVIDNPLQDIPLYGTLVSFFGGFTKEEIASVRAIDKRLPLFDLLKTCEINDDLLKERIRGFLDWLSHYRKKTAYTPIHKLIQEILSDTGYLDYVTACPGGKQRRANVEMLLTRAVAFENTSYYGLFHFLRYVEQLEKYEVDYGEADVLDENADVVRIMSIHKSKGLEFPVCFVAGLSKKFNMQDISGRLIADIDMGIGVDYIDSTLRLQSHTLKKNAVALKMKLDVLGEEMRVLYVAMTRAKEKLILTALTDDVEKFQEKLEQEKEFGAQTRSADGKVPFSVLLGAGCYLDFIFPCLEDVRLLDPKERLVQDIEDAVLQMHRRERVEMTETDNELMAQLSEQFDRVYPYQYLSGLFVKTTVSELKKKGMHDLSEQSMDNLEGEIGQGKRFHQAFTKELFEEPEIVPYIPSFMKAKEGMSGSDRGSAYHKVMELLDFEAVLKAGGSQEGIKAELNRQLEEFVCQGLLDRTWRDGISDVKLSGFFETGLAKRMAKAEGAGKLWREQPFVLGLPASRLKEELPEGEQVLIQGIIDVFFEEEGKIVVVDYKTDAVTRPEELVSRYQIQLNYYEEALVRLTDKEVTQKIIYSFALGREVVLY